MLIILSISAPSLLVSAPAARTNLRWSKYSDAQFLKYDSVILDGPLVVCVPPFDNRWPISPWSSARAVGGRQSHTPIFKNGSPQSTSPIVVRTHFPRWVWRWLFLTVCMRIVFEETFGNFPCLPSSRGDAASLSTLSRWKRYAHPSSREVDNVYSGWVPIRTPVRFPAGLIGARLVGPLLLLLSHLSWSRLLL